MAPEEWYLASTCVYTHTHTYKHYHLLCSSSSVLIYLWRGQLSTMLLILILTPICVSVFNSISLSLFLLFCNVVSICSVGWCKLVTVLLFQSPKWWNYRCKLPYMFELYKKWGSISYEELGLGGCRNIVVWGDFKKGTLQDEVKVPTRGATCWRERQFQSRL